MSHAALAAVVIPIVVAIALAFWITSVYRAHRHPGNGNSPDAGRRREVAGGSFRGHGGRQVMPLPNTEPDPELDATEHDPQPGRGTPVADSRYAEARGSNSERDA